MTDNAKKEPLSYEQAFQRLESILEEMNGRDIQLERSLELFEEANTLMKLCQDKLTCAEKKVEMILKEKNGTASLDRHGNVQTVPHELSQ